MADNPTTTSTQNLDELLRQSPFGVLLDIPGVDGAEDIFGNVNFSGGSNPFGGGSGGFGADSPYGGNPFAGDNFWNLFAGGVNPSNTTGNNPSAGFPTGTNNPSAGLPIGTNNPSAGLPIGTNNSSAGAPIGTNYPTVDIPSGSTPTNPFASDESFWEIFGGGVNPETFSDSNISAFSGGGNSSSTPVPEPSSVLGLAAIGIGIAATKFRQHQKRTAKAFNK